MSFTSPIPINEVLNRQGIKNTTPAPSAARMNSGAWPGDMATFANRRIAAAGSTMRFGMIRRSRSVADTTTRTTAVNAARTAPAPSGYVANAKPANTADTTAAGTEC